MWVEAVSVASEEPELVFYQLLTGVKNNEACVWQVCTRGWRQQEKLHNASLAVTLSYAQ